MPKGSKGGRGGLDRVVQVPFRVFGTNPFSNNNGTAVVLEVDLALANLGARAVAIGAAFEYFRFKSLSSYAYTDVVAADALNGLLSGRHSMAFVESNAALTGTATTETQMSQFEDFKAGGPYERLRLRPSKRVLEANAYKWFNTASTGSGSDNLSPGLFVYCSYTTLSATATACYQAYVIEGVLEFRGMITPALTYGAPVHPPASKREVSDDDELITVLSEVPGSAASPAVLRVLAKGSDGVLKVENRIVGRSKAAM